MNASNPTTSGGRAVIGASTVVKGEISGEEDLLVEGRVEGKIDLRQNVVTVGAKGRLAAEVHAASIYIEGEVEGDLAAEDQIVVRKTGRVRGDLVAPRVTLEDGARFKGAIDMEGKRGAPASTASAGGGSIPAPRLEPGSVARPAPSPGLPAAGGKS
ncbi:MAG: polymer-forming cytoskeletal protein [Thermoanaerobaculia bacterium]